MPKLDPAQMHYHIIMTQKCNLNCSYCGQEVDLNVMPADIDYEMEKLIEFVKRHEKPPVLAFYGGEPLIKLEQVRYIMEQLPESEFMIQTNGTLLPKLEAEKIQQFNTILISIDGREKITNHFRGEGTYNRAIKGAEYAFDCGYTNDTVARMAVTTKANIYQEVTHLLEIRDSKNRLIFRHVHWQLDAMWDFLPKSGWADFEQWLRENYMPGISKLVEYWIKRIEAEAFIPGIAPYMGVMHTLLTREPVGLRCGAGIDYFAMTTDGRITACPIPPSFVFPVLGTIDDEPASLKGKIAITEPCTSCSYQWVCGGRCLYANKTKHWGDEGFALVCEATIHMIDELDRYTDRIKQLIAENKIALDDFDYPKIANGVETIP